MIKREERCTFWTDELQRHQRITVINSGYIKRTMIDLENLKKIEANLQWWTNLRIVYGNVLFYAIIILEFLIGLLVGLSTLFVYRKSNDASIYIINTTITTCTISIGLIYKLHKDNEWSIDSYGEQRIDILESMCEIEIIERRYRNALLIRKFYEAQIDLVKIQRKRRRSKRNNDDDQRNKDEEDSVRAIHSIDGIESQSIIEQEV